MTLKVGADPEFIFTRDGKWVPPYGEHMSHRSLRYFAADGVNFELNPQPANTLSGLLVRMQELISDASAVLNAEPSFYPVHQMPDEIFKFDVRYGCRPDMPTSSQDRGPTKESLEVLAKTDKRRPAGGHIHLSAPQLFSESNLEWVQFVSLFKEMQDAENEEKRLELLSQLTSSSIYEGFRKKTIIAEAMLLEFSYAASLGWGVLNGKTEQEVEELERERRTKYGQVGRVRPKAFESKDGLLQGVEIRSLSAPWATVTPSDVTDRLYESLVQYMLYYTDEYSLGVFQDSVAILEGFPGPSYLYPYQHLRFASFEPQLVNIRAATEEIPMVRGISPRW